MKAWGVAWGLLMMATSIWAQDAYLLPSPNQSQISVRWSNDMWTQSDRYYTNGIHFTYQSPDFKDSPIDWLIPSPAAAPTIYGLSFSQDIFTPDLNGEQINRPFTATLMLGASKIQLLKEGKLRLKSALFLGIMGPLAGGRQIQNGIHHLLPASESVKGWDLQLANSILLNYHFGMERSWALTNWAELEAGFLARIGLPYTDVTPKLSLRFGKFRSLGQGSWQAYGFVQAGSRLVWYNATLQGGFSRGKRTSAPVMPSPVVAELRYGVAFSYGRFSLEVSFQHLSPEYQGGGKHAWGTLGLAWRF